VERETSMNNQEAKFILSAYRANGVDAHDEVFAQALRQAQRDPSLGAWLARQQAHDAEVGRKLREIGPPAGLRDAILTGVRVSNVRRRIWRHPLWMTVGAAAAAALVALSAFWWSHGATEDNRLLEFALNDTARGHHGDGGGGVAIAQTLLSDPQRRLAAGLPLELADFGKVGCRTLYLNGEEVFEVCFNRNGKWFHLYAIRTPPITNGRAVPDLVMKEHDRISGAMWSDPKFGYSYALVGDVAMEQLKRLL
ncbi:MAG TPA: hypothetical protein VL069_05575, partial [Opitutus sp.]|nr:hypothetical protein [Opitutus sp.]